MITSNLPYKGKPFIGIQITTRDSVQSDKGAKSYCLLQPTTEQDLGGLSSIPTDPRPDIGEWFGGIKGLAATVARQYGENYENHTTFEPPKTQRVGSDEHGWCTRNYETLDLQQRRDLREAADRWLAQKQ